MHVRILIWSSPRKKLGAIERRRGRIPQLVAALWRNDILQGQAYALESAGVARAPLATVGA